MLFIIIITEMNHALKKRIMNDYYENLKWLRIFSTLKASENVVTFSFFRANDLIFRIEKVIDDHVFESRRLYISHSIIKNILKTTHNDTHFEFTRCYEKIVFFIIYVILLNIYVIILNITQNIKFIKRVDISHMSRYNLY